MSLATSMKDLVEDIQASTRDRHAFVRGMSKEVKELIARFNKELKEMTVEIKEFLSHSEKARKEEFIEVMQGIAARLEDISQWQKNVRKDARGLVQRYAVDHKKAHEYWMSLVGQKTGMSEERRGRVKTN